MKTQEQTIFNKNNHHPNAIEPSNFENIIFHEIEI